MDALTRFLGRGWLAFPPDAPTAAWAAAALPAARAAAADPAARSRWLRCGGTWFAGVNVLPNAPDGSLGGLPLAGAAAGFVAGPLGFDGIAWDRAQVSICYPGYPRPWHGESPAAFRFRRDRDAAHLDGLLPVGPARRRMVREHHGFILGLPLTATGPGASPLVVWEGSHEVIRAALRQALAGIAPARWARTDVTGIYQAARRRVFETCRRVTLHAAPGGAHIVHRLAIHGVAPWEEGAEAPEDGRIIAYVRPEPGWGPADWLNAP